MKKILFSLFVIFSLFLVNTNVFAESSLDNFTFTEQDYLELINSLKTYLGTNSIDSYLNKQIVIYDSGIDIDYYDFNNGIEKRDGTVTLYMAKSSGSMTPHDDGLWITYNQQYLDCFYLEVYNGAEIVKNLETGEISVDTFPGGGSHMGNPMLNYGNTWLITYSNFDVILDNKTIFTPDNNFDISGSIEQGTGALNQPNKTIVERIWDTIKGIFNTLVNGFKNIVNTLVNGFKDMIDNLISLPEKIGNILSSFFGGFKLDEDAFKDKLDILMTDINNKFGFIAQTFDILIDVFKRFLNIKSGNHVINIPEIREPISNNTLINATSFDFDYVLSKNNISYLHTIYLSFVDVIILFALVRYGLKQFNRIFGGGRS